MMSDNINNEREVWPLCQLELKDSFKKNYIFVLIQIFIISTSFTSFLEYFKTWDELVCQCFLEYKARVLLHTIKSKMGGSSSKQEVDGNNETKEMVGSQTNVSLLDLHHWHSSSIGLVMVLLLLVVCMLLCAGKRYKNLHQEVAAHRACS